MKSKLLFPILICLIVAACAGAAQEASPKKDILGIMAAHRIPYAATISLALAVPAAALEAIWRRPPR